MGKVFYGIMVFLWYLRYICNLENFTLLSCISISTSGFLPLPPLVRPKALACLTGVWEGEL